MMKTSVLAHLDNDLFRETALGNNNSFLFACCNIAKFDSVSAKVALDVSFLGHASGQAKSLVPEFGTALQLLIDECNLILDTLRSLSACNDASVTSVLF